VSIKVKICGLTSIDDALAAYEYGADYLGFIGAPNTPRYVSPEEHAKIIEALPRDASTVIVVKELPDSFAYRSARIQYYKLEAPPENLSSHLWPVIRPRNEDDLREQLEKIPDSSEYVLLDAFVAGKLGGAGVLADWSLARLAVKLSPKPIILAGGLSPGNVGEAIRNVLPFGVDVSSGVEETLRKKSLRKVREFIRSAKTEI
jgi:phosphoribosylanthranilate isomerase